MESAYKEQVEMADGIGWWAMVVYICRWVHSSSIRRQLSSILITVCVRQR